MVVARLTDVKRQFSGDTLGRDSADSTADRLRSRIRADARAVDVKLAVGDVLLPTACSDGCFHSPTCTLPLVVSSPVVDAPGDSRIPKIGVVRRYRYIAVDGEVTQARVIPAYDERSDNHRSIGSRPGYDH